MLVQASLLFDALMHLRVHAAEAVFAHLFFESSRGLHVPHYHLCRDGEDQSHPYEPEFAALFKTMLYLYPGGL